jgi:dimethylamine monooxygenase subunit A
MQPGLFRFGTDFGNGDADSRYFPRDDQYARYLAAKARILQQYPTRTASDVKNEAEANELELARRFIVETMAGEGYGDVSGLALPELAPSLCEDFAVLTRSQDGDRVLFLHACFPSGWRPEQVLGQSFVGIPSIDQVTRKASSLVDAMLSRGPYVRFVWTISADEELDHHPEHGTRAAWSESTPRGYLRVERQTLVPLPGHVSSLFLIRTYLYGFDELTLPHRETLLRALQQMPPEILRYKGLENALPRALELLAKGA